MEAPSYESVIKCDPPPLYQPSINVTGRLLCKQELISPGVPASNRHWHRIEAELRGTTLFLSEASGSATDASSLAIPFGSYTLQAADVGLATDYKDRSDVFRLRVEGEQLLFIAPDVEAAVAWVESLVTAVMISDPLENRKMPKYPSIPPRQTTLWIEDSAEGLGRRLWSELAWPTRHREEWLLERPNRTRKERWSEVMHGRESSNLRGHSLPAAATSIDRFGPNSRHSSAQSRCQCPCASCWTTDAPSEVHEMESKAVSKENALDETTSALQQSIRCARTLTKWAEWKRGYYIRDGGRVKIPPRPVWNQSQIAAWPEPRRGSGGGFTAM